MNSMKLVLTILVYCVVLRVIVPTCAYAADSACSDLFADTMMVKAIHKEPVWARTRNLTEDERQVIKKIFDLNIPDTAKLEAAFKTFMSLTLRKQPEYVRNRVIEVMRIEAIWFENHGATYHGVMKNGEGVEITAPASYRETAVLQATRIHEFQHLINFISADANLQRAIKMSRFGPGADILTDFNFKQRYFDEYAAIRAEWEFISLIPKSILEKDIAVISSSHIPKRLQKSQLRRIQNASLSFENYIRAEHEAGRHSFSKFRHDAWFTRLEVTAVLAPHLYWFFDIFTR